MARQRTLIATFLFALLGMGLAHAAEDNNANALQQKLDKLGYQQGAVVERIQNYRVDGWNYLDDKHIMIYAGPSQRYLIGLMVNCFDLSTAERIGFSTTAQQLTKFDKLVVRGPGGMKQSCPISEMHELTSTKKKP